jgi:hypothetical protein
MKIYKTKEVMTFYKTSLFAFSCNLTRVKTSTDADFGCFELLPAHNMRDDLIELDNDNKLFLINPKNYELKQFLNITPQHLTSAKVEKMFSLIKSGLIAFVDDSHIQCFLKLTNRQNLQDKTELKSVIFELLARFKCHTKHAAILTDKIIAYQIKGYSLEFATTSEIIESYEKFNSCMTKYAEKMPLFYNTPYNELGKISLSIMVLKRNGAIIARGLYRHKQNKLVKCYGDSVLMKQVALSKGIKTDISATKGARLPIVLDDNGALRLPYIDSEKHAIYLQKSKHGDFLVIDSSKEDNAYVVACADNQDLTCKPCGNYNDYFNSDFDSDFTGNDCTCSRCDYHIDREDCNYLYNGDVVCHDCSSYCDECNETVLADDMRPFFYRTHRGGITEGYCCESCADNMNQVPFRG